MVNWGEKLGSFVGRKGKDGSGGATGEKTKKLKGFRPAGRFMQKKATNAVKNASEVKAKKIMSSMADRSLVGAEKAVGLMSEITKWTDAAGDGVKSTTSGATLAGAQMGAQACEFIPVAGSAIGGAIGGIAGSALEVGGAAVGLATQAAGIAARGSAAVTGAAGGATYSATKSTLKGVKNFYQKRWGKTQEAQEENSSPKEEAASSSNTKKEPTKLQRLGKIAASDILGIG